MTEASTHEFMKEALVMAQFNHEHVVRLIGVVSQHQPLLIVMEYCEFGSLEAYIRNTSVDPTGPATTATALATTGPAATTAMPLSTTGPAATIAMTSGYVPH